MSSTTAPVLHPTLDEFKDFKKYISKLEANEDIMSKGICKIVPPAGWFKKPNYNKVEITIPNPIRQCVSGRAGIFQVDLIEVRPMNLLDFQQFASRNAFESDSYAERERKFWRSLGVAGQWEDPIYGADYVGSLFGDDKASSWNVNDLDSILTLMGSEVPGVSNAMLYIGTWRAMFAFHVEDMNLYSINYVHTGASKSWYSIPQKYKARFESMAESYHAEDYRACHEFLRHKTKLFSPSQLKENGIEYNMVLQNEGEFVITFPGAYHAGFNHGYNIAEATNFATPKWIEQGRKAKRCVCRPFSVTIDMDLLETLFLRQVFVSTKRSRDFKLSKRMRCACNKNAPLDDPAKPIDKSLIFCCAACHLYCHKQCIYMLPTPAPVDESAPDTSAASEAAVSTSHLLCHICYSLENEGKWTPLEVAPKVDEKTADSKELGALTLTPGSGLIEQTKKRSRNDRNYFKINDTIAVTIPGFEIETVGVIVDLEDGSARVHQRGTKRENDIWIFLDANCRVIQRDGVPVVQSPAPQQKKTAKITSPNATKEVNGQPSTPVVARDKTTSVPVVVTPLFPDELFEKQKLRLSNMLQKMTKDEFKSISSLIFALCRIDARSTLESVCSLLATLELRAPNREVRVLCPNYLISSYLSISHHILAITIIINNIIIVQVVSLVQSCCEFIIAHNKNQLIGVRKVMQRFVSLAIQIRPELSFE